MKRIKAILPIALCLVFALPLVGCQGFEGYTGDYPELFSVAAYSIPNMCGAIHYEVKDEPLVCYLEEDEYGRVLFCYSEEYGEYIDGRYYGNADHGGVNLVICQGHDDEYAYYYNGCNYISSPLCEGNKIGIYGWVKPPDIVNPYNDFTDEQISKLKEDNDWGKEINIKLCS